MSIPTHSGPFQFHAPCGQSGTQYVQGYAAINRDNTIPQTTPFLTGQYFAATVLQFKPRRLPKQ